MASSLHVSYRQATRQAPDIDGDIAIWMSSSFLTILNIRREYFVLILISVAKMPGIIGKLPKMAVRLGFSPAKNHTFNRFAEDARPAMLAVAGANSDSGPLECQQPSPTLIGAPARRWHAGWQTRLRFGN